MAAPAPAAAAPAAAAGDDDGSQEGEWVEEDILLEIVNFNKRVVKVDGREAQFIGLETARPVMRLGNAVFEGEWGEVCGTAVLFDGHLAHAGSARKKISFKRVLPFDVINLKANLPVRADEASLLGAAKRKEPGEPGAQSDGGGGGGGDSDDSSDGAAPDLRDLGFIREEAGPRPEMPFFRAAHRARKRKKEPTKEEGSKSKPPDKKKAKRS